MANHSYIFSFIVSILGISAASSQNPERKTTGSTPYSLQLPEEWKRPRLIKAIDEIARQSFGELRNRNYCTDCSTTYSIRLNIDSVVIHDPQNSPIFETGSVPRPTYTFSFTYQFAASLVLDSAGHSISRLRLIYNMEIFTYAKDFTLPAQGSGASNHFVYDTSGKIVNDKSSLNSSKINITETPKHNARAALTDAFLRDLCEQRIFAMRKKLRNSFESNLP